MKQRVLKNLRKGNPLRKRNPRRDYLEDFRIPEKAIEPIAKSLKKKFDLVERKTKYASVIEVLTLLGAGVFLAASVVVPGLTSGLKIFIDKFDDYPDKNEWKKYNASYLARALRRLEGQKLVEFLEERDLVIVKITDRGRKKLLKYAIDELKINKPKIWDGKWRLVIYDVPKKKDRVRNIMRSFLKRMEFYQLQKSVYIHAYPCEEEVVFLREYLGISESVKILTAGKIENDRIFRDYFGV